MEEVVLARAMQDIPGEVAGAGSEHPPKSTQAYPGTIRGCVFSTETGHRALRGGFVRSEGASSGVGTSSIMAYHGCFGSICTIASAGLRKVHGDDQAHHCLLLSRCRHAVHTMDGNEV